MTDETLNAEAAAAVDSLSPVTADEVAPKEDPTPEASQSPPEASYEPPAGAVVESEYRDTSTLPPALRPCPAGPEPHRLEGRA